MIRKFIQDFATYGIGDLIIKASGFLTLPIYTRYLSTEGYGTWNIVLAGAGILSAILVLGGDSAYIRLFFEAKTKDEQQTITSTWFAFLAVWSFGITMLCVVFSRPLATWMLSDPQAAILVVLALLATPVNLMNTMCAQALRNQFLASQYVFWNVFSAVLSIGASLFGVIVLQLGVTGILGGALVAAVIILPLRLWMVRDLLRPRITLMWLKPLLAYGIPLMPGSIAYWVFASSDRLLLGRFTSIEQVGLYAVANQIANMIGFFYSALSQAWFPRAISLYETHRDEAPIVFGQMLTYYLILFGVLSVGISVFSQEIIGALATPEFLPAAAAVAPLALGFVAYASTQVTGISITLMKKTIYLTLLSWGAALVNVGLNLLLIPQMGMIAAAWSTALAYGFLTISYLIVSQRLWAVRYETRRALFVVALSIVFSLGAGLFPVMELIPAVISKCLYCLLFAGTLVIFGVIDQREWNAVTRLVQQVKARVTG